jgi:hypothetical protein
VRAGHPTRAVTIGHVRIEHAHPEHPDSAPGSDRHQSMSNGSERKRALVTGATRGIGKATALALAESGWDVAVSGRTLREGDGRDDSDTGEGRLLPGSLETTAAMVRGSGRDHWLPISTTTAAFAPRSTRSSPSGAGWIYW